MISFSQRVWIALIYTSIELTCGTLISKVKNSICACSVVSRLFIYASNKPLCSTLIISLGKNSNCACYCKQIKTSFARINKNTKYVLAIYYEQLHISAKTLKIKLLKFQQLIIYKSLLSCQLQCIKFKPHVKTLFLE